MQLQSASHFLVFITAWLVNTLCFGSEQHYQRVARDLHNQYRRKHHSVNLEANDELNSRAVECAQYYASNGKIDHSCPFKNGAGENLWIQMGGSPSNEDGAKSATDSWYGEEKLYKYNGDWQPPAGHFTQMLWNKSIQFGFGVGRKPSTIVGCALYTPRGNVKKKFKDNVFKP